MQTQSQTTTTADHNQKDERQLRREAGKNAGLKVIAEAVKSGKAWPLKNAGLLKALINAYRK